MMCRSVESPNFRGPASPPFDAHQSKADINTGEAPVPIRSADLLRPRHASHWSARGVEEVRKIVLTKGGDEMG